MMLAQHSHNGPHRLCDDEHTDDTDSTDSEQLTDFLDDSSLKKVCYHYFISDSEWKIKHTILPALVTDNSKLVTLFTCDAVFLSKVLRSDAHRSANVLVYQTRPQRVLQLSRTTHSG